VSPKSVRRGSPEFLTLSNNIQSCGDPEWLLLGRGDESWGLWEDFWQPDCGARIVFSNSP